SRRSLPRPSRHSDVVRETLWGSGRRPPAPPLRRAWPLWRLAPASPRSIPSAHRLGADLGKPDQVSLFRQVHRGQAAIVLGEDANLRAGRERVGREDPEAFLEFSVRPGGRAELAPVAVGVAEHEFVGGLLGPLERFLSAGRDINTSDLDYHRRTR